MAVDPFLHAASGSHKEDLVARHRQPQKRSRQRLCRKDVAPVPPAAIRSFISAFTASFHGKSQEGADDEERHGRLMHEDAPQSKPTSISKINWISKGSPKGDHADRAGRNHKPLERAGTRPQEEGIAQCCSASDCIQNRYSARDVENDQDNKGIGTKNREDWLFRMNRKSMLGQLLQGNSTLVLHLKNDQAPGKKDPNRTKRESGHHCL